MIPIFRRYCFLQSIQVDALRASAALFCDKSNTWRLLESIICGNRKRVLQENAIPPGRMIWSKTNAAAGDIGTNMEATFLSPVF